MNVAIESAGQPEVRALIEELDAYQDSLYPAESRHVLDVASLMQPNVLFAVARLRSGVVAGCGGIVLRSMYGELKRMYVSPTARGQGIALRLVTFLEWQAAAKGCSVIMLETGRYQLAALSLYRKSGYVTRAPFGDYPNDPLSVFMEKRLAGTEREDRAT